MMFVSKCSRLILSRLLYNPAEVDKEKEQENRKKDHGHRRSRPYVELTKGVIVYLYGHDLGPGMSPCEQKNVVELVDGPDEAEEKQR